jgi:hypothetical protein
VSAAQGAVALCVAAASLAPSCSPGPERAPIEVAAPADLVGPARFQIRGRWPADPQRITYRFDGAAGGHPDLVESVEAAMAVWKATRLVGFEPAREATADLVLGMRRGHHGACEPFGVSAAVAHAGPSAPGTFIHFDAGRSWSARGGDGAVSLFHTALHELGHVLGLGHSEDASAVMSNAPGDRGRLAPDDLAGLQSLYGAVAALPNGSLIVERDDGTRLSALCGVAPLDSCGHVVFDTDGDGCDEVLVYRTERAGHGAVTIYRFGPGARPVQSSGPFHGVVLAGSEVLTVREGDLRLLVSLLPDGRTAVRRFDSSGAPTVPFEIEAARARSIGRRALLGDLDGDGAQESVVALATEQRR